MATVLNPYLNFRAQAREAMSFYQSVLGGELSVMTFADQGGMDVPDDEKDHVMHSALAVSDSVQLMGADVPSHMDTGGDLNRWVVGDQRPAREAGDVLDLSCL